MRFDLHTTHPWFFAFLLLLTTIEGCGGGIHIVEKSPGSESFTGVEQDIKRLRPLGILKSIQANWDGVEGIPSDPYLVKIRGKFRETNLFHEVMFEKPLGHYTYVEMEVIFKRYETKNSGVNTLKSMAAGITLGLLAPLFPLDGTYHAEMQVKAFRSDGSQKDYLAKSSGTARAHMTLQNFGTVWEKLVGTVDGNNFNSILTQMVQDAEFFKVPLEGNQELPLFTPTR